MALANEVEAIEEADPEGEEAGKDVPGKHHRKRRPDEDPAPEGGGVGLGQVGAAASVGGKDACQRQPDEPGGGQRAEERSGGHHQ